MESKGDFWMDKLASANLRRGLSAASVLENQSSGDFSSHDGFHPCCSSSSSERNSSADLPIDGSAEIIGTMKDVEVHAMLEDAEVRAVLRKATINEGVLNKAIHSLGGGENGLKGLMEYIMVWVKHQRDIKSSSQRPPAPPPSNPAWNVSSGQDVVLQPSSDANQILRGVLQPPPTTRLLDEDWGYIQRLKSRKLMTGEPEMGGGVGVLDSGFCPSSFISSPEDCKPDVTSPVIMVPCIPPLNYGMQQEQPVSPFTSAHMAVPSVEPTPAMATKAARRHRMSRQRQSVRSRASSPAASPVSVGGGSLWNTVAAAPAPVTSPRMSGAQTKGRSTDGLSVLLQKELQLSDVGHLGRIILPKKEAEERLPSLATRGGVSIQMEDFDCGHAWNLRYSVTPPPKMGSSPRVNSDTSSCWANNKNRMYILENTAAFVISHGLVEGDRLVIYKTLQGGYVLRGVKKKVRLDRELVQVEFACTSSEGSLKGQSSLQENGRVLQWLVGGCPSDKSVEEEPVNLDGDSFLNELILNKGLSLESDSSCMHSLERFPSLNLDFVLEEIMAVSRNEPDGR